MSSTNKSLHLAHEFVISSGTITLNATNTKILAIHWRKTNELFLPKGRKDVGETLEHAATRETLEETGYTVRLLPLDIPTRATRPARDPSAVVEDTTVSTEPVAVSQRVTGGVLKIIFWFAARVDEGVARRFGTQQEGEEEFESVWVGAEEVAGRFTFEDDRRIVVGVLGAVKREADGR